MPRLSATFFKPALIGLAAGLLSFSPVQAQISPFMFAVAEGVAEDREIAEYYKATAYRPIWTGDNPEHKARRLALLTALSRAGDHALPVSRYGRAALVERLQNIETDRDRADLEIALTKVFLLYARDLQTGILTPSEIDEEIVREVPLRNRTELLTAFVQANPNSFMRSLPPQAPEYVRLLKAKIALERQLSRGGWGPKVSASALNPGDSGEAVVALRNRLIVMGYLPQSVSETYDSNLENAVRAFQVSHGLEADGIANAITLREINKSIPDRLPSVLVAIERERWMNVPRGERHIWVNLADFSSKIIDNDKVTFETRSVIGANDSYRRSPEFSDVMEYMEINPYWNVPRSISVREYLPGMIASGGASSRHLELVDNRRRVVSRSSVDWARYSPRNFPFDLRQPPSNSNALGLVKFMFPNRWNIYLHDTPAKSLFGHNVRAYSHGCIRLADPFDFAYALLAKQSVDPVGDFQRILTSGLNTRVDLETPVPVHIVYRTAVTDFRGKIGFRNDIYERDAKIFEALRSAGVTIPVPES